MNRKRTVKMQNFGVHTTLAFQGQLATQHEKSIARPSKKSCFIYREIELCQPPCKPCKRKLSERCLPIVSWQAFCVWQATKNSVVALPGFSLLRVIPVKTG